MLHRKIFIVGSPGAGKTTLAKKLSNKFNIPHFDLDDIRFPTPHQKRSDAEAIPLVKTLISKPTWIIEGIYITWIENHLAKADLIIFLDTPYLLALYRVVLRFGKNVLKGHLRHGILSTLILIKNMTMYHFLSGKTEYVTRHQTVKILSKHKDRTLITTSGQRYQ